MTPCSGGFRYPGDPAICFTELNTNGSREINLTGRIFNHSLDALIHPASGISRR